MKNLNEQFSELSGKLLQRGETAKVFGVKTGSPAVTQRRLFGQMLEIVKELESHVDLTQQSIGGEKSLKKDLAAMASLAAKMRSTLHGKIADNTYEALTNQDYLDRGFGRAS